MLAGAVIALVDGGFRPAPKIDAQAAIDLVLAFGALGHWRGALSCGCCCTGRPHAKRAAGAGPEVPSTFPAMEATPSMSAPPRCQTARPASKTRGALPPWTPCQGTVVPWTPRGVPCRWGWRGGRGAGRAAGGTGRFGAPSRLPPGPPRARRATPTGTEPYERIQGRRPWRGSRGQRPLALLAGRQSGRARRVSKRVLSQTAMRAARRRSGPFRMRSR